MPELQDIASVHCSPKHTEGLAKNLVDGQFLFSFFFNCVIPKTRQVKIKTKIPSKEIETPFNKTPIIHSGDVRVKGNKALVANL